MIARLISYTQHKMCENSTEIFFSMCHKIQYNNNFVAAFFASLFCYFVLQRICVVLILLYTGSIADEMFNS